MVSICMKQRLSNIWSWTHEKVKQHWVKKAVAYKKKCVFAISFWVVEVVFMLILSRIVILSFALIWMVITHFFLAQY